MNESGFFQIEADNIKLIFQGNKVQDLNLRIDLEIVNKEPLNVFWSSNLPKFSTPEIVGIIDDFEKTEEYKNEDDSSVASKSYYSVCLNPNILLRSTYINLNLEDITELCNTEIRFKIISIEKESTMPVPTQPPPKGGKGAPTPVVSNEPKEKIIFEGMTNFDSVFLESSFATEKQLIDFNLINQDDSLLVSECFANFRMSFDNDLAEYVFGSAIFNISNILIKNASIEFSVPCDDVIDPKAKVGPTESELRSKYLENIAKIIKNQSEIEKYHISLLSLNGIVPELKIYLKEIIFDLESATLIPLNENIRSCKQLWVYSFNDSKKIFVKKSDIRKLLALNPKDMFISGNLIKRSNPDGDSQTVQFLLDISGTQNEGVTLLDVNSKLMKLTNGEIEEEKKESTNDGEGNLECSLKLNLPFKRRIPEIDLRPIKDVSLTKTKESSIAYNIKDPKLDVKREFQQSIEEIVRMIADEYINQFPDDLNDFKGSNEDKEAKIEERKAYFMYYLSVNGKYHEFKEKIKPRIQRMVREHFDPKSLGLSGIVPSSNSEEIKSEVHKLLGEVFVLLIKECNNVLNYIYQDTLTKFEQMEFDNSSGKNKLDDEQENINQKLTRLRNVASDCSSDMRFSSAEQAYLERIQIANQISDTKQGMKLLQNAYLNYAQYMLSLRKFNSKNNLFLIARSKEVLELAFEIDPSNHDTSIILIAVCIELDETNRAEILINEVIRSELASLQISTLDDLDGYDTDKLYPISFTSYIMLSLLRKSQNNLISARRALRLAVKSFEITENTDNLFNSKPKRTAVLCLSQTSLFLFESGLPKTAEICLTMAFDSEKATTEKAIHKGFPADSPAVIRHILKKAQSLNFFHKEAIESALNFSEQCALVSDDMVLRAEGWVLKADLGRFSSKGNISNEFLDALLNANGCDVRLPLSSYILLCRQLTQRSRYQESLTVAFKAFGYYSFSATLLMLIGLNSFRLDYLMEAENALNEASLLDSTNPEIWAYTTLVNLSHRNARIEEAMKSLQQCLRIGGPDSLSALLLRELATSFISVDKFQIAEDLIRRALAIEATLTDNGKTSSYSRKLLADILMGQNQSAQAVEEYKAVMDDNNIDIEIKILAGENCHKLLKSLGRNEEANIISEILKSLVPVMQ